ncbi:MAG: D-aminoacyl-tRNA deacylase [Methanobacteriota archaeon]
MKLIAYSLDDVAGVNTARILKERFEFKETGEEFDGVPVYSRDDILLVASRENITRISSLGTFNPEVCIVVSRHRSESGTPTFTTHATGNYGSADVGGEPGRLSIAPAQYLRKSIEQLLRHPIPGFQASLEVTHHGPTELSFPLLYVEVGSSEKQWGNESACTVVAEVADSLASKSPDKLPSAIGFGGPHYAPNFTEVSGKVAFGHIAPKYAMDYMNEQMIRKMIEHTIPPPELAVLDWKGLRGLEKKIVTGILDEIGLSWKKTSELKD